MPSHSLIRWNGERAEALDEIENAHAMVGGAERGRRYAIQQSNYAYAALLSSDFQGFCRDLHSECIDRLVAIVPVQLRDLWRRVYLDRCEKNHASSELACPLARVATLNPR